MKPIAGGALAGLIFGLGLHLAGMSNPQKVLNFLDVTGNFDPSLALVMVAALAVTGLGYRLIWRRTAPVLDGTFHLPTSTAIDKPLILGAILFGLGWGLVGLCPGPALSALLIGSWEIWLFVIAMIAGIALAPGLQRLL